METLNRYGPEAGLSRLNEADAEIAAQIETLLGRKSTEHWQTLPMP